MTDILEYQASEAKAKWAELLDEVERGRTVRITRHGKTIARVVPEADATLGRGRRGDRATEGLAGENRQGAARRNPGEPPRGAQILSVVIDASVLAAWFLDENAIHASKRRSTWWRGSRRALPIFSTMRFATRLLMSERRQAHHRSHVGRVSFAILRCCPSGWSLPEDDASLMTLARKQKLTVYDAAYLELAQRERLPLATLDRALEKAAIAEGVALFGA